MKKNVRDLLASYVDALFPIIYINHFDFRVIDGIISEIRDHRDVVEFCSGLGDINFTTKAPVGEARTLAEFLDYHKDDGYDMPTIMVLKDVHGQISAPEIISLLKYIAERNLHVETYSQTVFIVSSKLVIPVELENYITVCDFPLPDTREIEDIVSSFAKDFAVTVDNKTVKELAISFKGLSEFQIKQILNVAYQDSGEINADDRELILHEKEQLIKKSGILETININEGIDDIGGLEKLKDWLYKKACIFNNLDEASDFGVDTPKGIMIVGMPGCGKSLAAKATAKLFNVPLVRLDIGRLMGKYVGESEENMRRALKLAEAISPCVLWIDEIEKAFSGIGENGGSSDVTTRLFGQFLTWMQEKENTVFIVATANNISRIPPEFLRKGRFDELFFVDFPNQEERKKILEIHLRKRAVWNEDLDLSSVAEKTSGYNGADLEAVVKDAVEKCFIRYYLSGKSEACNRLSTGDLEESVKTIESISKTLGNRIEQIKKAVENLSLKPASSDDVNFVAQKCVKAENSNKEAQKANRASANKDNIVKKCDILSECLPENLKDNLLEAIQQSVWLENEHTIKNVSATHSASDSSSTEKTLEKQSINSEQRYIKTDDKDLSDRLGNAIVFKRGVKVIKDLLELGANPDAVTSNGDNIFGLAVLYSNNSVIRLLIDAGANPNTVLCQKECSVLYYAVEENNAELVRLLIDAGADVNFRDRYGISVLARATRKGNKATTEMLLRAGATMNGKPTNTTGQAVPIKQTYRKTDDTINNALFVAIRYKQYTKLKTLLERGANPNATNSDNCSLLCYAVQQGDIQSIQMLIDAGANPNSLDSFMKNSALYDAVYYKNDPNIVKLLIASGADVNFRNRDYLSVLDIAGREDIKRMLIAAGATK